LFGGVRVFVCFLHDISKTYAASITKLDTDMVHHESWKLIYFGVRGSKVKVTMHKTLSAWIMAFL